MDRFVRPFQVSLKEYPFEDRWFFRRGKRLHYVDEGEGEIVLFIHGNPTWSFLYRNVIKECRSYCRCIAPDLLGFGMSGFPDDFTSSPHDHVIWLNALLDELKINRFFLVGHDWGGPIGLAMAVSDPQRIQGIILCNTWCWAPAMRLKAFSLLMTRPVVLRMNAFVRFILPLFLQSATREILEAYHRPFPKPASRQGIWRFTQAIRESANWLQATRNRLPVLNQTPVRLVWGMRDPAFGYERVIERWKTMLPTARVYRTPANHYLPEDAPKIMADTVRNLIEGK